MVKDQEQQLSQINKVVAFFDIQKEVQTKLKDVQKLLADQAEIQDKYKSEVAHLDLEQFNNLIAEQVATIAGKHFPGIASGGGGSQGGYNARSFIEEPGGKLSLMKMTTFTGGTKSSRKKSDPYKCSKNSNITSSMTGSHRTNK